MFPSTSVKVIHLARHWKPLRLGSCKNRQRVMVGGGEEAAEEGTEEFKFWKIDIDGIQT
jgi:hypothetical protein